eukprot:442537-Pleurochrysis_carterae.AAC.1
MLLSLPLGRTRPRSGDGAGFSPCTLRVEHGNDALKRHLLANRPFCSRDSSVSLFWRGGSNVLVLECLARAFQVSASKALLASCTTAELQACARTSRSRRVAVGRGRNSARKRLMPLDEAFDAMPARRAMRGLG